MVKIVILDGYCLNPGDLNWGELGGITDNVIIYDRTPPELIIERAQNAEIIIINKVTINKDIIDNLPKLKYIGILATGYNGICCDYAKQKGIVVTNVPAYSTESVVQHIFGMLIEIVSGIGYHHQTVKNGVWQECQDFCYYRERMIELNGKTMGIIGFGNIGKRVKDIALSFGMKVLVNNRDRAGQETNYSFVPLRELFQRSDIISLNCPLNSQTENMINADTIALMKPTAIILNTARGGLINENDLATALNEDKILAAGVDVLSTEPPQDNNPLLGAKNIIITPHIAWATKESRSRLMSIAISNIKSFLEGKPKNVVNK